MSMRVESREYLDALRGDPGGLYWARLPQDLSYLWPLLTSREQDWWSRKHLEMLKAYFEAPNTIH